MGRLFGTDGVRGIANQELSPELAFKLGRAAAFLFGRPGHKAQIVIGRDTRLSGTMLEAALTAGICSAGGDVISAGVIPTAGVAFLCRHYGTDAGVVISASHNPFPDNGIKFFSRDGYKLPDETEDRLEEIVLSAQDDLPRPTGDAIGHMTYRPEAVDAYADYVVSTITTDLAGLKLVVDCANGAAAAVAPQIYRRIGAQVTAIHHQPNGVNINVSCGSTHPQALQQAVLAYGADVGIAHDGDADRMIAVDEKGQVVDGDQIMAICGLALLRQGRLKGNTIVATVMSNIGLHEAIRKAGGRVVTTQVGDRYVLELMRQHDFVLGGEQSGHIIFRELNTTGDGLITALQLLATLRASGDKLSALAAVMTRYPQLLVNVRVKNKDGWEENRAIQQAIKAGEDVLGERGRVLVRPSGTEPLIRVMAEGPDQAQLHKVVQDIANVIAAQMG